MMIRYFLMMSLTTRALLSFLFYHYHHNRGHFPEGTDMTNNDYFGRVGVSSADDAQKKLRQKKAPTEVRRR